MVIIDQDAALNKSTCKLVHTAWQTLVTHFLPQSDGLNQIVHEIDKRYLNQ